MGCGAGGIGGRRGDRRRPRQRLRPRLRTAEPGGVAQLDARAGRLRGFARIDNLLDRAHIGSLIVNEANGRYYEPGPGRSLVVGIEWQPSTAGPR